MNFSPASRLALPLLSAVLLASCAAQPQRQATSTATPDLSLQTRLHLADVAERDGANGMALSMYRQAALKDPNSVEAQTRYAGALAEAGQIDQAQSVLSAALKTLGQNPGLLMEHGRICLLLGQAEAALADFRAVLDKQPANLAALTNQGVALDLLGRHAEAAASYRHTLAIAPQDAAAANDLALSLLLGGNAQEAARVLAPVASRPDATARVRANYAVALAASGQQATAEALVPPDASKSELLSLAAEAAHGSKPVN